MKPIPNHLARFDKEKKIENCPNKKEHQYGPEGYIAWDNWATRMSKTYYQEKCECGYFLLWIKK